MKVFGVLACVLAVSMASPSAWTVRELGDAIENPTTDSVLVPVLENALNIAMDRIMSGAGAESFTVRTHAGSPTPMTLNQLESALTHSGMVMQPYLEEALNSYVLALMTGQDLHSIDVTLPALELSYWTLADLDTVLSVATTSHDLVPYYEAALNELMRSLFSGKDASAIVVAIPVNLLTPAVPLPEAVVAPPEPAVQPPKPVAPAVSSSPLVEIILNVQNPNLVDVVNPVPAITGPEFVRPTPQPIPGFNPIDILAPLPVEHIDAAVPGFGPM